MQDIIKNIDILTKQLNDIDNILIEEFDETTKDIIDQLNDTKFRILCTEDNKDI